MEEKDYLEYDKQIIFAKKDKVEEIKGHYSSFGWKVEKVEDNTRYEDIVDITFFRPHKIKSKDELQLLQVHMEERVNEVAKYEKYKTRKSTVLGLSLGGVIVLCLLFTVLNITKDLAVPLWVQIMLVVIFVSLIVIEVVFLPKIYNYELKKSKTEIERLNDEITNILEKVEKIIGEKMKCFPIFLNEPPYDNIFFADTDGQISEFYDVSKQVAGCNFADSRTFEDLITLYFNREKD